MSTCSLAETKVSEPATAKQFYVLVVDMKKVPARIMTSLAVRGYCKQLGIRLIEDIRENETGAPVRATDIFLLYSDPIAISNMEKGIKKSLEWKFILQPLVYKLS